MVSKFKQYNGADEYRGQSTDVKPVANNGDVFHEIDTGKDFMYNESAGEWKEQPKKGGGGGGGGSVTVDDTLSSTSENPVQNNVIKAALDDKAGLVGSPLVANTDLDTLANGVYYTHTTSTIQSLVHSPIASGSSGMTLVCFGGIGANAGYRGYQFQVAYDNTSYPATNPSNIWIRRASSNGTFADRWRQIALGDMPSVPTTNGTYQLTIEDGVASWTSVAGLSGVDEAERADDNEACYVKQVIEANELRNELYCDSNEEGDNA